MQNSAVNGITVFLGWYQGEKTKQKKAFMLYCFCVFMLACPLTFRRIQQLTLNIVFFPQTPHFSNSSRYANDAREMLA